MKNKLKYLAGLAMLAAAGASQAAIDITPDTTAAKADVSAAGVAIIGVVVAAAAFTWIRRVIR